MRHGQAISNVKDIVSCWPEKFKNPITKLGKKMAKESAEKLKGKGIDLIFASPLLRTKMTSEIVGRVLNIKPKFDMRLREQSAGVFNGRPFAELQEFFGEKGLRRFKILPPKGETYIDIKKRMGGFLKAIDKKHKNKTILIVSHELPLIFLDCAVKGVANKDFYLKREKINTAEARKLN